MFESGCGDVGEEEDELLEIASNLWMSEHGGSAEHIEMPSSDSPAEDAPAPETRKKTFWDLTPEEQDDFVTQARSSGEFKKFVDHSTSEENTPEAEAFGPFLPEERTLDEFQTLLGVISKRLHGPPTEARELEIIKRWMEDRDHSDKAEDYLQAVARFLNVRGALWGLEALQDHLADKIDRRIIPIDAVSQLPPAE